MKANKFRLKISMLSQFFRAAIGENEYEIVI